MSLLISQRLTPALAEQLRHHGVDAAHVCELGLGGEPDRVVLAEARRTGRTVVTSDVSDFEALVTEQELWAAEPPVVACVPPTTPPRRREQLLSLLVPAPRRWVEDQDRTAWLDLTRG